MPIKICGPLIQFGATAEVYLVMLCLLVYATYKYVLLVHDILQSYPLLPDQAPAPTTTLPAAGPGGDAHPPSSPGTVRAIDDAELVDLSAASADDEADGDSACPSCGLAVCGTEAEDRVVALEDDHRMPSRVKRPRHPTTSPASPSARFAQPAEEGAKRVAQLSDETISGTDSACIVED
ncbi:uncharacterized protein PFL1_06058 [Pseudozyma flocculosa PF-1]|uniref:Uncharacterized protein n=2 Tax=Pseudozyma flocculosa TaxID=84751 RepID=A0A5C3F4V5_9BASI|nr:uncharacterized protein PFL1_06058 [Pseudozyma flocculosa PF-1]EPQ26410.1 hypothetical protein PFL1_06058 [Pseudozyma flocculosa PF-1]SPO38996.1 uncharacterized protein PSFLO_04475 [Pseudozyma flocculosa]